MVQLVQEQLNKRMSSCVTDHSLVRWVCDCNIWEIKMFSCSWEINQWVGRRHSNSQVSKETKKTSSKTNLQIINKMMECTFCSLVCGGLHKVLLVGDWSF